MSLLGLDIGTTGSKAVVFRKDGEIISKAYRDYPLKSLKPGWFELDPLEVLAKINMVIKEAANQARTYEPISCLGISCAGGTVIPVNKKGIPVYNAIPNLDQRTVPGWYKDVNKEKLYKITGQPTHTTFSINPILWLKHNRPDVFNNTWKFYSFRELFLHSIGLTPFQDHSLASTTMLYDLKKRSWSEQILELIKLDKILLPDIKDASKIVGTISENIAKFLDLPNKVQVVLGGHDSACAAIGTGLIKSNMGICIEDIGTYGVISTALSKFDFNMVKNSNFFIKSHIIENLYLVLNVDPTAGSILKWYKENFASKDEIEKANRLGNNLYEFIIQQASTEPSPLLFLPHFAGSGGPLMNSSAKGAIVGLSLSTTKSHIIRSILEGIGMQSAIGIQEFEKYGIKIDEIRSMGGGALSKFWVQIRADIIGKPLITFKNPESGCLGAAILAGVSTGVYSDFKEAIKVSIKYGNRYFPNEKNHKLYTNKLYIYREAFKALNKINT